ncbi:hypothetical protein BDV19DRAFT_365401 [Aspergillus venezuelensis]
MEPAGLALGAVGLLGLLNLYTEAVSVVQSIKNHPSESLRIKSRYNATRVLFELRGKQVGFANDKTSDYEETVTAELKDPATTAAVADLLVSIRDVFSVVDPTLARYDGPPLGREESNQGRTKLRSRLRWAFADGDKLENQVEDFDEFVQKLYSLVPPQKVQPNEFQTLQASLIKDQRVQALQRLTHWLDATTTENTFDAYCSTRIDNTCNWINMHPTYQGWASDQGQIDDKAFRVLWIHGPAGFGKSVLCAYLINSLLNSGKLLVCSFFCSGDSDAQRSPSAIPRSWVYQAVYQDDNVLEMALQYLDKCEPQSHAFRYFIAP